jgi:predicted NUDIX family phosphoesterase
MTTVSQQQSPLLAKHDEMILVVPRTALFPKEAHYGMVPCDDQSLATLITKHQQFMPRSLMEQDPSFKQIIPCMVYKHNDMYFLMQRKAKATETRLQSKFTLAIGGHIREEDLQANSIIEWAQREFEEEVSFDGSYSVRCIGLLNDDTNAVGQVHVGVVYLLEGDSSRISIKEEHEQGMLMTLDECEKFYDRMESWTQIIFNYLKNR